MHDIAQSQRVHEHALKLVLRLALEQRLYHLLTQHDMIANSLDTPYFRLTFEAR